MQDIDTLLNEVIDNSEKRYKLSSRLYSNSILAELASVLAFAESGTIKDSTISRVRKILFSNRSNNGFLLEDETFISFSLLADTFLTENELVELVSESPELIAKIINKNHSLFSSEMVKAVAKLYS